MGGELHGQDADALIDRSIQVAVGNWIALYVDPTGELWKLDYPSGNLQGGGPPRMSPITIAEAERDFGVSRREIARELTAARTVRGENDEGSAGTSPPRGRSSDPRNIDPKAFVPLLEGIRDILLKHDFVAQGTVAAELVDLAHLESPEFVNMLRGGAVWGSAGSIADLAGLRRSLEPVDDETERDSVELRRVLIQLADEMREQGVSSEGSDFVASAFRRGFELESHREDPH